MSVYMTITGTYSGFVLMSSSTYVGISITSTGSIGGTGMVLDKAAGVVNFGHIGADSGNGIDLTAGGTVKNFSTIDSAYYTGVIAKGATTVTNSGLIHGDADGVMIQGAGSVLNKSGATISGTLYDGVSATSVGVMTIDNYGTITGAKYSLDIDNAKDRLIVETGAVFNGYAYVYRGTLELRATSGTITHLDNYPTGATISGAETAAAIGGFFSYVFDAGASWTIASTNALASYQTISDAGTLTVTGSVANAGTFTVSGSLTNTGTIAGAAGVIGVSLTSGGHLVNSGAKALISGKYGVYAPAGGAATVTNFGSISGTTYSVVFESSADRLILEAGATLTGFAYGGGGALELAGGSETISGLGGDAFITGSLSANIGNFGTYVVDAAASVVLSGAGVLAANKTLSNGGAMDVAATLSDKGFLDNTGFMTVENGASLEAQGFVANAGTIDLAASTSNTDLLVLAAGATIGGAGTVQLGGSKSLIVGATAAATLINVDNTISGKGELGANSLTLLNETKGVVDASSGLLTVATKGETLTNQGLMEAASGATLVIANTTVANSGGTILANTGASVKLQDDVIRGGGITAAGTGVVKINLPGGELNGTASAVSLSGFIHIVTTSNEILEGSIANSGDLNLTAGSKTCDLIVGAAGVTLSGGGVVNLSNSLGNRIYGQAAGDTLTNVNNRIDGAGLIGNGIMTLVNQGGARIIGNQNLSLTIDTGTNTIVNAGIIENVGKGGTMVMSAVDNTGTFLVATAGTLTLAGAVTGSGVGQINGGTLYVQQAFAETVTFSGSTGVLELGDSQAYTGFVTGLSHTGASWLDLADIGFFSAKTKATYSGTSSSGTLTVTDGTHTAHITLIGDYLGASWTVSGDGHGGTKVVDPSSGAAPLSQAIASFHPRTAPGLAAWTARPPPRLLFVHAQT